MTRKSRTPVDGATLPIPEPGGGGPRARPRNGVPGCLLSFGTFVGTFLSRSCVALQHTGLSENIPDWRVLCYTVRFGPILRFLYWSMNYHIEHHMFAVVPFHNLTKLHRLVQFDYPAPQKRLLHGMRNLFAVMKKKSDPGYVYSPVFPETVNPVKWR